MTTGIDLLEKLCHVFSLFLLFPHSHQELHHQLLLEVVVIQVVIEDVNVLILYVHLLHLILWS